MFGDPPTASLIAASRFSSAITRGITRGFGRGETILRKLSA